MDPKHNPPKRPSAPHPRAKTPGFAVFCLSLLAAIGCDPENRGIEGIGPLGESGYAIVASDGTATSVALLEPDGAMRKARFIDSGSASTGLVTALSGDVSLPTAGGQPGVLTVIDRFRTDVITRVNPESGEVLGQVKTHRVANENATAYSSNPHDYVYVGPDEAWVTRFGPNPNVPVDDPDRGSDLQRIDPTNFELGERISFAALNTEGTVTDTSTGATQTVTVFARPSRMVRLGDKLVVGLARLSQSFDAIGPGMVALVDLPSRRVEGFALPQADNCGTVAPLPSRENGDDRRVLVSCVGFFRGNPRETAGLFVLRLTEQGLEVETSWLAKDHPDAALAVQNVTPISRTELVAVAYGQSAVMNDAGQVVTPATNDIAYRVNLETGAQTQLFEADGQFRIGSGAYNAALSVLMVPDASVDADGRPVGGLRRFTLEAGSATALTTIDIDPALPPRLVCPL